MQIKRDPEGSSAAPDMEDSEVRVRRELGVRRALGLTEDAPVRSSGFARYGEHATDRPKRRFAQDGDVPVVLIQSRREPGTDAADHRLGIASPSANRAEAAEAALKAERDARERAERALAEAQAAVRDMQTKLGHAMLALDEARESARRAQAEKRTVEMALGAEQEARGMAEDAMRVACAARDHAEDRLRAMRADARSARSAAAGRLSKPAKAQRRGKPAEPEPEPVKWW
jgi:hypothetical protein